MGQSEHRSRQEGPGQRRAKATSGRTSEATARSSAFTHRAMEVTGESEQLNNGIWLTFFKQSLWLLLLVQHLTAL